LTAQEFDDIVGVGKTEFKNSKEEYYGTAFELSDKGLGSFERCLHIINVTHGNLKDAQEILSKLMMKDAKYQK
jgi:hypothetical protein